MKCKIPYYMLIISFIANNTFSQEVSKIGEVDEVIYPFELNEQNLYFNFFKSKSDFDRIDILGMGEATHGTKEFFEIKKATFEYLVLNHHYRIFGIEASFGGCSYINDYVNIGVGKIDSVLLNFDFWTWRTEEVKDLILWIKDFNVGKNQNDKIIFYGFDIQNFYSPIQYLSSFIKEINIPNGEEIQQILKPVIHQSELEIYKKYQNKNLHYNDTLLMVHDLANT